MQTLPPTLCFCASPSLQTHLQLLTPVICRKHLPLQATHKRQATLIIRSKYDHLGLAAHSTTVSLCYKTHHWVTHPHTLHYSPGGIYCSAPLVMSNLHQPHSFHKCLCAADLTNVLQGRKCNTGWNVTRRLPSYCADLFFFVTLSAFFYRVSVQTQKQETNWSNLKLHVVKHSCAPLPYQHISIKLLSLVRFFIYLRLQIYC